MAEATGCRGGLCVLAGVADPDLALELARSGRYLVQVLPADAQAVDALRAKFQAAGLYGLVSVDGLAQPTDARLPYSEDLVNVLLLGEGTSGVSLREAARVLAPGGSLLLTEPRAETTALDAAGLQAVKTVEVGRAWRLVRKPWPAAMDQWSYPRHAADNNPVSHDRQVAPPRRVRWVTGPQQEVSSMVTAGGRNFYAGVLVRDAFNGLKLWETALTPSPARGGFNFAIVPGSVPPLAVDDRLYVFNDHRVQALDAVTGRVVAEYPEAGQPQAMLVVDGTLLAVDKAGLRAVAVADGRLRWQADAVDPRYVVAGDGNLYLLEGGGAAGLTLSCRTLADGKVRWRKGDFDWLPKVRNLVYHDRLLACEISTLNDNKPGNMIHMLSADDGTPLWNHEFIPGTTHKKQARAMFVGDLVWVLEQQKCVGLDARSGAVRKSFPAGGGHCFPPVATDRYLLAGELDLTDLQTGTVDANRITKGACSRDAGWIPANGLIYAAPKHCICWPMLRDYTALAPARPAGDPLAEFSAAQFKPERGPASLDARLSERFDRDWPCYRHDALRSGSTAATVPVDLQTLWDTSLGERPVGPIADDWRGNFFIRGPVGPPVVADGLVFVTRPDAHQVVALDLNTGATRWTFTANGRVDTAPTIHNGACLFGSKSGWVYCLRADSGQLVWRLRAAPVDEQIVAYGQLESPWPVPGSVLVVGDVVYFAAGRQSLADGGILLFAVNYATGEPYWVQRLASVPQKNFYDSSGLEFDNFDLLYLEGDRVAMSRWQFDRTDGKMTCDAKSGFAQMTTPGGSVWFPRGSWSYAPRNETEHWKERPYLRPLAVFHGAGLFTCSQDRQTVFRRDFAATSGGETFDTDWFKGWETYARARKGGELWQSQRLAKNTKWSVSPFGAEVDSEPIAALVLTRSALLTVGAKGRLTAIDPADGKTLGQTQTPPIAWDAVAAVEGRVLLTTQDGHVVCLGKK